VTEEDKVTLARRRAELVESLATPLPIEERARVQGELTVVNAKIKALNTTEAARNKAAADRRRAAGLAEAQANAARARAKIDVPPPEDVEEDDDPGQTQAINEWIVTVLHRGGVKTRHPSSDGPLLLVDVPAKWTAIIEALCLGIHAAARGQELPDLADAAAPRARRRS
jgi:hypothetical protein